MVAAGVGFLAIALFLLAWYRLPGLIAVLALVLYVIITLALYRLIPVTLSAAGIAGFIISIGMAVDANILIFERTREERARGKSAREAMEAGFSRAWVFDSRCKYRKYHDGDYSLLVWDSAHQGICAHAWAWGHHQSLLCHYDHPTLSFGASDV